MITVVIPTLNEENYLQRVLTSLAVPGVAEVVVVDGGSQDRTCQIAGDAGVTFIESQPGRGTQMATGAGVAKTPYILFLHADTIPPIDFVDEIGRTFADKSVVAGAFRLGIDLKSPALHAIQYLANLRCRIFESPYGDQGIFVRRQALVDIGGVAQIPLLEDVDMIRRLKKVGRVVLSLKSVRTSGRSWSDHGTIRTTMANVSTCVGYVMGVNPVRLANWRKRILSAKEVIHA